MLAGSVTSTGSAVMRSPFSISASSRSQAMTSAPSAAKARAIARPMPRAAPATITVLPSKRISIASRQLVESGFPETPDYREGDDRRGDQVPDRRDWRAEPLDHPDREVWRRATEDRDRQRIAGGHPGRAAAGREDLGDRRRPGAGIERDHQRDADLDQHQHGEGHVAGAEVAEQRPRQDDERGT